MERRTGDNGTEVTTGRDRSYTRARRGKPGQDRSDKVGRDGSDKPPPCNNQANRDKARTPYTPLHGPFLRVPVSGRSVIFPYSNFSYDAVLLVTFIVFDLSFLPEILDFSESPNDYTE